MKEKKSLVRYLPSAAFLIVIFVIPVLYLTTDDLEMSALEKRNLAQMPEPTSQTVLDGSFGENFETYLADQMPMRTMFVGINAYWDTLCGRNGANGIYSGRDGYLFTAPVEDCPTFDNNIKYIGEFIDDIDVPSYVCVVPSSGYINSDKLPANCPEYKDGELTAKVESAVASHKNAHFIDLTEPFLSLAGSEQLYYKTDHHWTSLGAYECSTVLSKEMGFTPFDRSDYTIETAEGFRGTNYSKAALWLEPSENIELWHSNKTPDGSINMSVAENGEVSLYNSLFFYDNLKTDDKYTVFLDGNHALVTLTNENAQTDKKLLILRDSYSHCLAPFLADYYREIVLADVRYYRKPVSDIVRNEGIDQVLLIYSLDSIVNSNDIAGIF